MGRHQEVQSFSYSTTGTKTAFLASEPGIRLFQISGSWTTLAARLEASILGTAWVTIEASITAAAGYVNFAPWPMYRIVITTLTGATPAVNLDFLIEKELRRG